MTHDAHESHDDAHGHGDVPGHVVPPRILIGTALALLVLTGITVGVAGVDFSHLDMPELNIWVALGVAAVKASLVALFFMHLRWDRPFNGIVFVLSIAFVALFIGAAMTDSFSYHDDLEEGNSKLVVQKLSELEQYLQSDAAKQPLTQEEH